MDGGEKRERKDELKNRRITMRKGDGGKEKLFKIFCNGPVTKLADRMLVHTAITKATIRERSKKKKLNSVNDRIVGP